jgi:APA family basic amino acid/polyamine antiporter
MRPRLRTFWSSLLRRKSADALVDEGAGGTEGHGLRRSLGAFDLTLMGVGAIVGAGIFSSVGEIAAGGAGAPGRRARRSCSRSC